MEVVYIDEDGSSSDKVIPRYMSGWLTRLR
jgi:hypothetical protein